MNVPSVDDYRELATITSPSAVSQYLAAHGWQLESQQPAIRQIWHLVEAGGGLHGRVMLPLATDFADYHDRLRDVLLALSQINGVDAHTLQEQISSTRADMFFVRLDQEMLDGTIPFKQVEATIESLHKMLRAAATTAANPLHSHRGRRPAAVSEFLEDDVRLGHTKRGSFIFTIVARLGDPLKSEQSDDRPVQGFARQVMETLAFGLETTRDVARLWDPSVLDAPGERGLSASLVEAVEEITQPTVLRSLDLSFGWAVAEPSPTVGQRTIVLDRELIAKLPRVREQLVRREGYLSASPSSAQ